MGKGEGGGANEMRRGGRFEGEHGRKREMTDRETERKVPHRTRAHRTGLSYRPAYFCTIVPVSKTSIDAERPIHTVYTVPVVDRSNGYVTP